MDHSHAATKLWIVSLGLLLFDVFLVNTYISLPTVLDMRTGRWDFRIAELRVYDADHTEPIHSTTAPEINTLLREYFPASGSPAVLSHDTGSSTVPADVSIADAHGSVL